MRDLPPRLPRPAGLGVIRHAGSAGAVVIAGAVARQAGRGGHAWAFLQYVLGFRRLGWQVLWLDSIDGACVDAPDREVREFRRFVEVAGIEDDAALLAGATAPAPGSGRPVAGLDRRGVLERVRRADLFINVMGYIRDEEILGAARRTLFLDIDPGFGQMWEDLGLARLFHGHDAYATVGVRVGAADCRVPTLGIDWIPTPPPVVLQAFDPVGGTGNHWTSVCSWRGQYGAVEHGGRSYGLRVHEFRRFLDLPRLTGQTFHIALDIDEADAADRRRLTRAGWTLLDPAEVAGTPEAYREFIGSSAGEFTVAKGLYVDTRGGWFSDRSVCYLASGRPVVAQDTGWSEAYPADRGLLPFTNPEGAREAIAEVASDRVAHGRAAREVAEATFDSDVVLTRLADLSLRSGEPATAGVAG